MDDVVIVAALRTGVGSSGGTIGKIPATELGAKVIAALIAKTGVDPELVSEVLMGQVLAAAAGQNPARQASIRAGLPNMVPAMTINKVCGSGLKATHLAAQAIKAGDADIVIAGGQESMSLAPHALNGAARRIAHDGRQADRHHDRRRPVGRVQPVPHGASPPRTSRRNGTCRARSRMSSPPPRSKKAEAAQKAGRFRDEIVPITISTRKGDVIFDSDEFIRHARQSKRWPP